MYRLLVVKVCYQSRLRVLVMLSGICCAHASPLYIHLKCLTRILSEPPSFRAHQNTYIKTQKQNRGGVTQFAKKGSHKGMRVGVRWPLSFITVDWDPPIVRMKEEGERQTRVFREISESSKQQQFQFLHFFKHQNFSGVSYKCTAPNNANI